MTLATSPGTAAFRGAAGLAAGVVGPAGGITSLVSSPALPAVGVPPLAADATNLVALVACWPGSALVSRRELAGAGRWLARGLPGAGAGAAGGGGGPPAKPPRGFHPAGAGPPGPRAPPPPPPPRAAPPGAPAPG